MQEIIKGDGFFTGKGSLLRGGLIETVTAKIAKKRQAISNIFRKNTAVVLDEMKPAKDWKKDSDQLDAQRKKIEQISDTFSGKSRLQKNDEKVNEKEIAPMLSSMLARPSRSSVESKKSQFEEIMIERVAMNPRDIEAYERLGEYYMQLENYDDAKECYKQVLRLSPVNRKAKIRMRRLEKIFEQRIQV